MTTLKKVFYKSATLLVLGGFFVPMVALAGDGTPPDAPAITVNGVNLPQSAPRASSLAATSSTLTNPWSVIMTYSEDILTPPMVIDGLPNYTPDDGLTTIPFGNGTPQTINDCSDGDSKTFCFSYTPPAGQEAAIFWYFQV